MGQEYGHHRVQTPLVVEVVELPIVVGDGGWVRFVDADGDPTYVRATESEGPEPRLFISELYMERPHGFTNGEPAASRLHEMEERLNDPGLRGHVLERMKFPGVDLATATDYITTSFPTRERHWLADMLRSQLAGSGVPRVERKPPSEPKRPRTVRVDLLEESKLEIPEGRRRPDSFYLDVLELRAELKRWAPRESPSQIIAAANGVPVTTVDRWIRKGREISRKETS